MSTNKPTTNSTEILNRIDRFTSTDLTIEELRESLSAEGINPEEVVTRMRSRLAPLIALKEAQAETNSSAIESAKAFPGILAAASNLGLTAEKLGELTGLKEFLLVKIDRRLVSLEHFSKIAEIVAEKIQTTKETIENYAAGLALYPAEANFKAETAPDLPQKQSFDDAVTNDPLLSEEEKQYLLSLRDSE